MTSSICLKLVAISLILVKIHLGMMWTPEPLSTVTLRFFNNYASDGEWLVVVLHIFLCLLRKWLLGARPFKGSHLIMVFF